MHYYCTLLLYASTVHLYTTTVHCSPAAATGGSAHVHPGCGGVSPLGDGEVNTNLPVIHLSAIQSVFSLSGVILLTHYIHHLLENMRI